MNKLSIIALAALFGGLMSACSGEKSGQEQSQSQSQAPAAQAESQQLAKYNLTADPYNLPKDGKVVKAMHAGGYTYMQIEKDGKEFWIAATMMSVKRDDYVRWADAAVMKNFNSSTLHKSFDEILFVTNAELNQ